MCGLPSKSLLIPPLFTIDILFIKLLIFLSESYATHFKRYREKFRNIRQSTGFWVDERIRQKNHGTIIFIKDFIVFYSTKRFFIESNI